MSPTDAPSAEAPRRRLPVIGLLGAPGSGKSTVAAAFGRLGATVIDADALARDALNLPEVRRQLVEWWGEGILGKEGRVDRKAVGQRVFDDAEALAKLEALIHPLVHAGRSALRQAAQLDPASTAIVEDCPLLLESGLDRDCDMLVLVDTPLEVRRERVRQTRGWSDEELARREKNQWPLDSKRRRADYVLDGDAPLPDIDRQARDLLDRALRTT